MWLDEILAFEKATRALQADWFEWLLGLEGEVENGPLFHALQLLARALADGEVAARLAPAVLGALSVGILAIAGSALGGRWVGLAAALLLAVSPLHVYYSREGRPYALVMFTVCVLLAACLRKPSALSLSGIYGACLAAAYAGAFSGPMLASAGAIALILLMMRVGQERVPEESGHGPPRQPDRHLLAAAALGVALLGLLYLQFSRYKPALSHQKPASLTSPWSEVALERMVSSLSISGVEWASFELRALVFYALVLLGWVAVWRRSRRRAVLLLGMAVLPVLSALATLTYLSHWYSIRYTSSALPALILLSGAGLVELGRLLGSQLSRLRAVPLPAVLGSALALGLALPLLEANWIAARQEPFYKVDWRKAAAMLTRYGADDEFVVVSNWRTHKCLSFYLRGSPRSLEMLNVKESLSRAEAVARERSPCWLITAGFHRDWQIREWMRSFQPIWETNLEGLGLYYYPDFRAFVDSRSAGDRGDALVREFVDTHRSRLEFDASEVLLTGQGWSQAETNPEGISFRWAQASASELAVGQRQAGDSAIRFRALPFEYPDASPQTVEILLNDRPIAQLQMAQGWQDYSVLASAADWRPGINLLTLKFGRTTAPSEVISGSSDTRQLAVAFDFLEISRRASTVP